MTRYALPRREPLLAELEAFCDLLAGDAGAPRRHARGGPGRRSRAPRPCWPARPAGETVVPGPSREGRRRRARARSACRSRRAIARAGHEVVGCDVDPRVVDRVNAGEPPFPGEAGLRRGAGRGRRRRPPARPDRHDGGGGRGRRTSSSRSRRSSSTRTRGPDWRVLDAVVADIGRGLRPGTTVVSVETTRAGRHDARRASPPRSRPAAGCGASGTSATVFSPERVFSGRVFRDLETYPKLVGGLTRGRRGARRRALRARSSTRRGVADGLGRGGRADEARRDDLPRRQHRASPTSSPATPTRSASTSTA